MPMSPDHEVDKQDIEDTGATMSKLMKVSIITDPKFSKFFTGVGCLPIKPVDPAENLMPFPAKPL